MALEIFGGVEKIEATPLLVILLYINEQLQYIMCFSILIFYIPTDGICSLTS